MNFEKYVKYKKKYLLLKNKLANKQKGGGYKKQMDKIIKIYKKIPLSGISDNNDIQFKTFCKYLIKKTKNNEEIIQIKRKKYLESNKLTDSQEYKKLLKKINERGIIYKTIGEKFEKLVFTKLFDLVKKDINITKSNTEILKNPNLYLSNDGINWELLGEIDAIIIKKENNIKYIIGICEFKHNFDDIPDALFQIKRSYDAINSGKLVKLDNEILDKNYKLAKLAKHKSYLDISFIFTSSLNLDNQYFNIGSKLKHYLINILYSYGKLNYKKILNKLKEKQIYNDKLNNDKILRYNSDVLETIQLFKNVKLLNRLKIINSN
jgi:hypothetical protein